MFRKRFVPLVLAIGGLSVIAVQAQQTATSSQPLSLSQRLDQFRRSLVGQTRSSQTLPEQDWSANRKFRNFASERTTPETAPAGQAISRSPLPLPSATGTSVPRTRTPVVVPGLFSDGTPHHGTPTHRPPTYASPKSSVMGRPTTSATATAAGSPAGAGAQSGSSRRRFQSASQPSTQPVPRTAAQGSPPRSVSPAPRAAVAKPAAERGPAVEASPSTPEIGENASQDRVLFARKSPILAVETSGPRKITIGKESTFEVLIKNAGDVEAGDVVVTVSIPEWCEIAGTRPTAGATRPPAGGEPLRWRIALLEANGEETLSLKIVPRQSRPFDLAVAWTYTPPSSQAMVEVQEPKLLMAISGPEEVRFGQTKLYKLTLSNPGTGDAENVKIELMPIDPQRGEVTSHALGRLKAGDNRVIEIELTARQSGKLRVQAQATADGGLAAKVDQAVLVRRAELRVDVVGSKVKYAGTVATYNIRVTNPGTATAENVDVSASLPQGAAYVSSSGGGLIDASRTKVTWTLASLRENAEELLEVKCVLNTPGANRIQVVTQSDQDLRDAFSFSTNVEALADLKLEVKDPQGPIPAGEEMVYEVRIRNRGTKAAQGVDVIAFFSGGIEPTGVEGTDESQISQGQVTFKQIPHLAAGKELVYKIKARAAQAGNHTFRAEVECLSLGTKLAAEETTRFFGEAAPAAAARTARRLDPPRSFTTPDRGSVVPGPQPLEPAPIDRR